MGEDLPTLGAEGVGVIEDRGDAALLIERQQGNFQISEEGSWHSSLPGAPRHPEFATPPDRGLPKEVQEITVVQLSTWSQDVELG